MLDVAYRQIAHVGLDDYRPKPKELPTHSWYIIAYVVDFGQFELHHITPEETMLRHLAETLICQDEHREIPHDELIRKQYQPQDKPTYGQQKQLQLRLPDQRRNTGDHQWNQQHIETFSHGDHMPAKHQNQLFSVALAVKGFAWVIFVFAGHTQIILQLGCQRVSLCGNDSSSIHTTLTHKHCSPSCHLLLARPKLYIRTIHRAQIITFLFDVAYIRRTAVATHNLSYTVNCS